MIVANGRPFNVRKATTEQWYNVAIGTSEAALSINLINRESRITVELYIDNCKEMFDRLYSKKEEIESELDLKLDWRRLDNKKASRILSTIPGLDFNDHSNYPQLMNEIIQRVIAMRKVFTKYI